MVKLRFCRGQESDLSLPSVIPPPPHLSQNPENNLPEIGRWMSVPSWVEGAGRHQIVVQDGEKASWRWLVLVWPVEEARHTSLAPCPCQGILPGAGSVSWLAVWL